MKVNITSLDTAIGEKEFREQVAPCLTYLEHLTGSFGKKPPFVKYYPPSRQNDVYEGWSLQCEPMISVGKQRGEHLMKLYDAIVDLIEYELPDFDVQAEFAVLKFD